MARKTPRDKKPLHAKHDENARPLPEAAPPPEKVERKMKPAVIIVGADKGGVGKTTISRALLDYLSANHIRTRAFDTETPRGTLHRFHPEVTTIVDMTSTSDQMKIIDTLEAAREHVSVIDVRAGGLTPALIALRDMGFLEAVKTGEIAFILFHVLGSSIASLDEIDEIAPYVQDARYFLVKNHVNDTTFFDWDPVTHRKYFEKVSTAGEITIPKLNEMSYEQVEIAGTPYSTFVANKTAEGDAAGHSFVLRGYVRTWQAKIAEELDRVGLLDLMSGKSGKSAKDKS